MFTGKKSLARQTLYCGAAALVVFGATPAFAQDTATAEKVESGGLEEITVTARKKAEKLETVPFAISALSSGDLYSQGITNLTDLSRSVPGFNFQNAQGANSGRNDRTFFNINFRGLYLSNVTAVSQGGLVFVDGAPVLNAQTPALNDIERVEVLKGPQSAYFGRSTFSGAVNFITKDPGNEWSGHFDTMYGSYGSFSIAGSVTVPVVRDILSVRLGGSHEFSGGTYKNFASPYERFGNRATDSYSAQILFTPAHNLKMKSYIAYGESNDGAPAQATLKRSEFNCNLGGTLGGFYCGALPGKFPTNLVSGNYAITPFAHDAMFNNVGKYNTLFDPKFSEKVGLRRVTWQANLRLDWTLGNDFTISTITAAHSDKMQNVVDLVGRDGRNLANPVSNGVPYVSWLVNTQIQMHDFSQEVRVTSPQSWPVRFTLGANYFEGTLRNGIVYGVIPTTATGYGYSSIYRYYHPKTPAVFGAVYADITKDLTLTVEGRYQWDKIEQAALGNSSGVLLANPLYLNKTFKSFSPRVSLDYTFAPNSIVYALFSRGTRPGGFNESVAVQTPAIQALLLANGGGLAYDEEKIVNFEGGIKSRFWNNKASVRISAYVDKYKNAQISNVVLFTPPGTAVLNSVTVVQNAGLVDLKGIEFEGDVAPLEGLRLSGTFAFNGSKIKKYVCLECKEYTSSTNVVGNHMIGAPQLTWTASANYERPVSNEVSVFGRVDYRHQGRIYVDYANVAWSKHLDTVDLRFGAHYKTMTIEGFVSNITNQTISTGFYGPDLFSFSYGPQSREIRTSLTDKRRFGVRASFDF